jgi:hypothetical protein
MLHAKKIEVERGALLLLKETDAAPSYDIITK